MSRFAFLPGLLLAGFFIVMSGLPSWSASKSNAGGVTDTCEQICKHCPLQGVATSSQCHAACTDCYIRSLGRTQFAPAAPSDPAGQPPQPLQNAK